ncbi:MAG: UDP-N-acetylmuramoyl-tripeptide--D-alanyl-D-alanine ligase [Cytophagaceae bacterium]
MKSFTSLESLYNCFLQYPKISTDTRKIEKDSIFFALKGANFNGNTFATQALEAGAAYVVIDEEAYKVSDKCLLVEDVLTALQQLARLHRRTLNIPVIAITGSNGKTTSKELVNAVLSKKYKTYATIGNLNNHIGIPLTLLSLTKDIELAVVEMGANHQKEIESYCQYAEPNFGLITNIGKAHLEGFGGIEGVKKGKGELYHYLNATGGKVFLHSTNETLKSITNLKEPITYANPGDYYQATFIDSNPVVRFKAENGEEVISHLAGAYNYDNIVAALCIGKYFGVDAKDANQAIREYNPTNNRSQILKTDKNTLIMDCYNANPSSMKAAIENFNQSSFSNKIAVLGDMFELGADSAKEHALLGDLLNQSKFDKVLLCGKWMAEAKKINSTALYFETKDALIEYVKDQKYSNATVLLKGSRGMGLEVLKEWF